jgi:hypothetical protein
MNNCPLCEGDLTAKIVHRWVITIAGKVPNQNDHRQNAGPSRWAYRKERDEWIAVTEQAKRCRDIPDATGYRRVIFTRLIGKGKREWDLANLIGGLKPVVDAMVHSRLLIDDAPKWFSGYYRQVQARENPCDQLRVEIQELEYAEKT